MIPYREREICQKYNRGEPVPAGEFNNGGLDFFHDVVYPMWRQEQATAQLDFFNEVWWTRVKPLEIELAPDKPHEITGDFKPTAEEQLIYLKWQSHLEKRG